MDTSALLSFTAENFRSYRDEAHLSLLATRTADKDVVRNLGVAGSAKPVSVLPVVGIFGANASGKTVIFEAMDHMRYMVLNSFPSYPADSARRIRPLTFLLDGQSRYRPCRFEIDVIQDGVRWQYGCQVSGRQVLEEHAYHYPRGRRALVFRRKELEIEWGPPFRAVGRASERFTGRDILSLSVAAQAGDPHVEGLYSWFHSNMVLVTPRNRDARAYYGAEEIQSERNRQRALSLLRYADLGLQDAEPIEPEPYIVEQVEAMLREVGNLNNADTVAEQLLLEGNIWLKHSGTSGKSDLLLEAQSQGTRVWLGLVAPVLYALDEGTVLLVDELNVSLHAHLVKGLISIFQDSRTNPRCAQLIFNSHDTSMFGDTDSRVLCRDQVWFTEKESKGATRLYPLSDFSPRQDEALERRYLQGRYGAVPSLKTAGIMRVLGSVEP